MKLTFFQIIHTHYIFLIENIVIKRRINRSDSSSNFFEYLLETFLLTVVYFKTCIVIRNKKRLFIRYLVYKYCSAPKKSIRFVSNYGLDIGLLENGNKRNALCFGLHDNCVYEQSLCSVFNINVIACDPTPISEKIFGHQNNGYCFSYFPLAISNNSGPINFFMNDNTNLSGGSIINCEKSNNKIEVQGLTFNDFKEKFKINHVDVLKIDIDGGEKEILLNLIKKENKNNLPNQICLELDIDLDSDNLNKTLAFLEKMRVLYKIYFIPHKIRYTSLELLFIKK